MAISINADDKTWVKSVVTAALTGLTFTPANMNYQIKSELARVLAVAEAAQQAVS